MADGRVVYVVNYSHHSSNCLKVYDPEAKKVVLEHRNQNETAVRAVRDGIALINVNDGIEVLCLNTGKVLKTIEQESQRLRFAKFDSNPERKQFVVYSEDLKFFQLLSYDDNEVKLINTGSAFINDHKITLRSVVLLNGIFFVMSSIEALSFVDDDVTSLYWPDLNTTMLLAYDLKSSKYHSGYPIVSLIQEDEKRRQTLLNGFVSNFKYIGDRIAPSFLSDDILLLSTGASNLLQLNFSRSPRDLAEYEAGKLFSVDKKHQKLDQLIAKYTGKTLNGVVQTWKRSFGFLSCKGEASELGGIFLHIANVENKTETFFKKGVLVEFTIEYDKTHQNFRANWANLLQLSFSHSPHNLGEKDAAKLLSVVEEQTTAQQRLDQLITKYTGKTLNGVVQTWKSSFGFLSCTGEASKLGSIFLHIANVENKTEIFFKKGVLVEFTVEYDKTHQNFQANWAKGLVANFKKSNYRGRGGGRGKGDHHTQGNCD